jgi:peptidoglycan hydrolase-like protein with peptidoglycan-binding domain
MASLKSPRYSGLPQFEAISEGKMLLKKGARGIIVKNLQKGLSDLGFSLGQSGIDGIFGDETERALKKYQLSRKLQADGIFGPLTMGALDSDFMENEIDNKRLDLVRSAINKKGAKWTASGTIMTQLSLKDKKCRLGNNKK